MVFDEDNKDYDKYSVVNDTGLEAIHNAENLFKKESEEVERHHTLMNLTNENIVRVIKNSVQYIWINELILLNAQKWISIRKDCDKRRNYDEKTSYNFLTTQISEALELHNVEIRKIISCGTNMSNIYAFAVRFISNDTDYIFELQIPIIKNLTIENREYARNGKLSFGYKQMSSCWNISWNSYNIRDFKEAINEITTSEKYQTHVSAKEA